MITKVLVKSSYLGFLLYQEMCRLPTEIPSMEMFDSVGLPSTSWLRTFFESAVRAEMFSSADQKC